MPKYTSKDINSKRKIKLTKGLISLSVPLGSNIDASRNIIDIIGAILLLPGSINQKDPNIPRRIGEKKYLINLLFIILTNK